MTLFEPKTPKPPQLFHSDVIESTRTLLLELTFALVVLKQLAACSKARPRSTTLLRPETVSVVGRTAASTTAVDISVPAGGAICSR